MVKVSEELAHATVLDEAGATHVLDEVWRERTAVVVWIRHFG